MSKGLVIGIDIGGTNFRIGAVDGDGNVLKAEKLPVMQVLPGPDAVGELESFIKSYCEELPERVEAVAIGFPAPLDKSRGTVLQAPNLPFIEMLPVKSLLSERLGIPVLIERDVNMLLSYDMEKYGLSREGVICAFYFGTGIGNAIFINGRPYVGKNGAAGELGHIPADGCKELCGCGNIGCIESIAGGRYLAELQRERFPETPMEELFVRHGEHLLLRRFVDTMAQSVSAELNILDPDYVLVGGGVVNMAGFPRQMLLDRIREHCRKPYPAENLELIFTEEEEDKGIRGAAAYCRQRIK